MKQKTLRYLFLLLLVFALPILMLPNNAGAWSYVNDGAMPAGIVSGGSLTTQGLTFSGKTASDPAIFGGWSVSSAQAGYIGLITQHGTSRTTGARLYQFNCLGCHINDGFGGGNDKSSYLLTGHKNMARKVAGASYSMIYGTDNCSATGCAPASPTYTTTGKYWWTGPTGNQYITDSATNGDKIDFTTGMLSTSGGVASSIYYIGMHGWMEWFPLPSLTIQNSSSGGNLCGECHVTGSGDVANTLQNNGVANYTFLTASQPEASTLAALKGGVGPWVLDGVQCTACHDSSPTPASYPTGTDHPVGMGASVYENATELCFSCHQGGEVSPYVDGTSSGQTSHSYKPALSMKVATNTPNFNMSHGTPSLQFFNSPHGRFTGTAGANNQGSRGVMGIGTFVNANGTQTINTQTANMDPDQVWQPGAYASLFKNAVSNDQNQGRNYGCALACHDPHITTVDAVNAQPMQIGCNGYTYTVTGGAAGLTDAACVTGGNNCGNDPTGTAPGNPADANTPYGPGGGAQGISPIGATGTGTIQPAIAYNCHQGNNTVANNPTGAVTSAGAPLAIDLTQINHPVGVGTPLDNTSGDPSQANDACVICHMPRPDNGSYAGNGGSSEAMKLHLFRINTSANYSTFPAYTSNTSGSIGYNNNGVLQQANTANDGSSFPGPNAVWVDLDLACGQCHGGGATQNFTTGSIVANTATLAITNSAAANAAVANMKAGDRIRIIGSGISNNLLVAGEPGAADQHSFIMKIVPGVAAYTITLTEVASTTVSNAEVITNPTINGANYFPKSYLADMAANMHNQSAQVSVATTPASTIGTVGFTATLVDNSTSGTNITVNWGDGNLSGNAAVSTGVAGGTFSHTYPSAGKYTVTHTASTGAASSIENISISVPTNFTLSGTVTNNAAGALVGATVILKQNGITKKVATSIAGGAYSFSNVPFGTYTISAYDASYTFTPASITVNANTVHTIAAN
jgi:hypothetical protein